MMRITIDTPDRGHIPINMYAVNLASSGQGKGHSTNIIEEQVISKFRHRFLEETFPILSDKNLIKVAAQRASRKGSDADNELILATKEFDDKGPLIFSFDSGTTAAVKQMRDKLLLSGAGSMNMEIDEIGSNLMGNIDVLTTFLELFDVGKVKQKLTKNTAENTRSEEIIGKTPTNMMLFGTPSKLFDGGKVETEFTSFLDTGYARRCFFGYSKSPTKVSTLTPLEIYDMLTDKTGDTYLLALAKKLSKLADIVNFAKSITISKDVSLLLIEYRCICERESNNLLDNEEIRKAEIDHRYFKVLKLAGTYAFIDGSSQITEDHLYNAIRLAEDSGEAFRQLLLRDRNYTKLANYIAKVGREVTHVDLVEDLTFYKGTESQRAQMMNLAIAYGYKNNIIIKKTFNDGIEFLKGETLNETDLDKMVLSYGLELAENYGNQTVKFDQLHRLTQLPNYHWVAHHLIDGYRKEENALPGFNLVVLDVDDSVTIDTVQLLMKNFKYLIHTTKRHTAAKHRFRIILPMSHTLKLDPNEYKEFMNNIYEWLPFSVDLATNQRARKWLTHKGQHEYNDGELLDSLLFIPKTTKNEKRKNIINDQQSLSNVERWFVSKTDEGNRSNQLIKYALMMVDSGMNIDTVKNNVLSLNSKLPNQLPEAEILSTILVSASKAIFKRDTE